MDNEGRNDFEYRVCVWCGHWITKYAYLKRVERDLPDANVCKDCRDIRKSASLAKRFNRRTVHPELGVLWCVIWQAELNEDWLRGGQKHVLPTPTVMDQRDGKYLRAVAIKNLDKGVNRGLNLNNVVEAIGVDWVDGDTFEMVDGKLVKRVQNG
jgi:hypothetical protein